MKLIRILLNTRIFLTYLLTYFSTFFVPTLLADLSSIEQIVSDDELWRRGFDVGNVLPNDANATEKKSITNTRRRSKLNKDAEKIDIALDSSITIRQYGTHVPASLSLSDLCLFFIVA